MKHKRSDRPVEKTINIPTSIISKVDAQIVDPITTRPPHGAYSRIVTALLRKWLDGEVEIGVKIRTKVYPFCPTCLLDSALVHTCNNPECPMPKEEIEDRIATDLNDLGG